MTVQGIILDVDGTLVSSNDAHAQAWVEAFSDFGYDIAFDQVRPLIGMGGDQVIPRLVPELNDKEGVGQQIADRRKELIINKFGAQLEPTPGARDLVQKLHDEGLNLIVASSATGQEMDILLNVAQVSDLVSDYTTSDDAENSKPDPGIVEAALSKAHLSPDRALMLGDTPYDIESAEKAGVGVIAFRTGGFSDQQLQGAIAIYDSPADLLNHYDSSPLAAAHQNGQSMQVSDLAEAAAQTADQATTSMTDNWRSFQGKATTWLDQATTNMATFFRHNGSLLSAIGWSLLAVLGIRMLFALLHVLDNIPLITPLLELIGFAYVIWFVRRYLLRVQDRQELVQTLNRYKTDILGR
jgi:HAD superfamily hydrolase (TIGR01509 family)